MTMDGKLLRSLITVILTCLSFASLVSSTANKKTGTCCSDGLGLNYTLPMFIECKKERHSNGSMVQKIPKLIPYSEKEAAACPRRKNKLGIKPGHRVCRFPDCASNPCVKGWCEETMENFKCHCPAGYRGKRCNKQSSTSAPSAKSTTPDPEQPSTPQPTCQHPTMSTTSTGSTIAQEASTMGSRSTTTQEASTMGSSTSETITTSESSTTQKPSTTGSTTSKAATTLASSTDSESTIISTMDSITSGSTTTTASPTTRDATTMSTTMESTTSNPRTPGEPIEQIFVTDEGTDNKIFVADLQDVLVFTSIPSTKDPQFITYDSVDKKIYWTDKGEKRVYRADVDGGNRETVTNEGSDERRGIAIAETSRTLYIANKGPKTITSMSIGQGSALPGHETEFVNLHDVEPISLEVDEGYLYWTTKGGNVRRQLLVGSGGTAEDLHADSSLSELYGLSIGPSIDGFRYIFYCDFGKERTFDLEIGDGEFYRYELTSHLQAAGYSDGGIKLRDITYYNGVLYWTKEDSPSSIAVMTNYLSGSRSYEIKETSGIVNPYQLLITTVYP